MGIYIAAFLFIALIYLLTRRGKKASPAPDVSTTIDYAGILAREVEYYQNLDDAAKKRFEQRIADFLQQVNIEGVGLEINDTDRILVAASAVIPVFGFDGWKYKNLTNVILYPDTFDRDFQFEGGSRNIMGMVGTGYMNGQMLLSRSALVKGFSKMSGKSNTGIHEFVHLLDKADGATDGIPEQFLPHEYATPWLKMMHQEMHRIKKGNSDIDDYALTNEAEFLAVTAEYFFEKPEQFEQKHPEIYEVLSRLFAQDPAND